MTTYRVSYDETAGVYEAYEDGGDYLGCFDSYAEARAAIKRAKEDEARFAAHGPEGAQ